MRNGRKLTQPLPANTSMIVSVREIEDWFLAECNHYTCIDTTLELTSSQVEALGFHPCSDDLTTRSTSAAMDLRAVYQLAGKYYNKSKKSVERTVECLDYANLYLHISRKLPKLHTLVSKIDQFLT